MTQENEKALLELFGVDTEEQTTEQATEESVKETEQTEELAEESDGEIEESDDTEDESTEQTADAGKDEKLSVYEQAVLAEMNRRAEQGDELLATAMQSADKSIKECWKYITTQARKQAVGSCAMIEDAIVFGWAHHYYIESKETIDAELKPKGKEKTAEQKKAEETKKKVYENPLLAALAKKGAKVSTDEVAVTKTTTKKDAEGNILSSKSVKTDAEGTKTTTIEKGGKTYTMTEFALF